MVIEADHTLVTAAAMLTAWVNKRSAYSAIAQFAINGVAFFDRFNGLP